MSVSPTTRFTSSPGLQEQSSAMNEVERPLREEWIKGGGRPGVPLAMEGWWTLVLVLINAVSIALLALLIYLFTCLISSSG